MKLRCVLRLILLLLCGAATAWRAYGEEAPAKKAATRKAGTSKTTVSLPSFSTVTLPESEKPHKPADKDNAESVRWLTNMNDGYRRAIVDRKPILIWVGAKWCEPWRKMAGEMLRFQDGSGAIREELGPATDQLETRLRAMVERDHARVRAALSPHLDATEQAWLKKATRRIRAGI